MMKISPRMPRAMMGLSLAASVGGPVDRVFTLPGHRASSVEPVDNCETLEGPLWILTCIESQGCSLDNHVDHVGTQGLPILRSERALVNSSEVTPRTMFTHR